MSKTLGTNTHWGNSAIPPMIMPDCSLIIHVVAGLWKEGILSGGLREIHPIPRGSGHPVLGKLIFSRGNIFVYFGLDGYPTHTIC